MYGVFTFTRKIESFSNNDNQIELEKPGLITFILKGYFLNIANMGAIVFWMGVVQSVISGAEKNHLFDHIIISFSSTLLTIFSMDILKCFTANKIKAYLKPKILIIVNHTIGVILVLFGLFVILKVFFEYFKIFS